LVAVAAKQLGAVASPHLTVGGAQSKKFKSLATSNVTTRTSSATRNVATLSVKSRTAPSTATGGLWTPEKSRAVPP